MFSRTSKFTKFVYFILNKWWKKFTSYKYLQNLIQLTVTASKLPDHIYKKRGQGLKDLTLTIEENI